MMGILDALFGTKLLTYNEVADQAVRQRCLVYNGLSHVTISPQVDYEEAHFEHSQEGYRAAMQWLRALEVQRKYTR